MKEFIETSKEIEPTIQEVTEEEKIDLEGERAGFSRAAEIEEEERKRKEEEKIVKIKGAKPINLGEDYPMIFFEQDPFVLVFNTSHPLFCKLVEEGKLGNKELGILFERMMEAAYCNENPSEEIEKIKERWKVVDKKLIPLFKKLR